MIEDLYGKYLALTADSGAAATLVLAHVQLENRQKVADGLAPSLGNESMVTVKVAAQRLRVSTDLIYDLCRKGELEHVRWGGAIRIPETALSAQKEKSVYASRLLGRG